jgi:hypothetical protein
MLSFDVLEARLALGGDLLDPNYDEDGWIPTPPPADIDELPLPTPPYSSPPPSVVFPTPRGVIVYPLDTRP